MSGPAGGAHPKVWVVLVNWNGWRDSVECLESVLRLNYPDFGVIVCDNDSSDGSVEAIAAWAAGERPYDLPAGPLRELTEPPLPKPIGCTVLADPGAVRIGAAAGPAAADPAAIDRGALLLVRTGANLGFAAANNIGIRLALSDPACRFVWLLNNDTVVDPACLERMVAAATVDPATGITGSLICFYHAPDRVQALGGGRFFPRRARARLHGNQLRRSAITPALRARAEAQLEWVSGASMLVSRRFIEHVGEMEERYFLYWEEIDWALRASARFKNVLAPGALVYHKAGGSTGAHGDSAFATYMQCRARFKLYRKLLPGLLPLCYLRTARDLLGALLGGRRAGVKAIWRAGRDDWSQH